MKIETLTKMSRVGSSTPFLSCSRERHNGVHHGATLARDNGRLMVFVTQPARHHPLALRAPPKRDTDDPIAYRGITRRRINAISDSTFLAVARHVFFLLEQAAPLLLFSARRSPAGSLNSRDKIGPRRKRSLIFEREHAESQERYSRTT